jgi:spore germination cell wall hydrolase CwlJ-like protein
MKKYLAMFLCFSFLLGNPVEAAISNGRNEESQAKSYLTSAAERDAQKKTSVKSGNEEINLKNGAGKTKNHNNGEKTSRYSPEDLDLLARLVHAEAKGEPYQGKIAVAATVLNRVEDPCYPDTIPEVIYEYNHGFQYCPVRNGEINCPADEQAFKAVEEALEGKDPTGGALSFFNPSKSFNVWIRSRAYLTEIGNHIFVK